MNKQEIMELVDEYGHLKHSQGMDDNSDFADRRRNADRTGKEADEIRAAIEAALPDVPAIPKEHLALNVQHADCHKAADAFWDYWKENGETHKRGYYESTWGAINRALRTVGVMAHNYGQPLSSATALPDVPTVAEGWSKLLHAANEVLSWTNIDDRPPRRDEFETGRMAPVRVRALADLHDAVQALSAAPEPAQAEPVAWHINHRGSCQIYTSLEGLDTAGCTVTPLYTAQPQKPDQEPVHWRALLDAEQVPHQLKTSMHVCGFRDKNSAEQFVIEQADFYGWRYTLEPLYKSPQQPAQQPTEVEKFMDACGLCKKCAGELSYPIPEPAQAEQPATCKELLQVQCWVIPHGGSGQFSWDQQDERFWTRMVPAAQAEHIADASKLVAQAEQPKKWAMCTELDQPCSTCPTLGIPCEAAQAEQPRNEPVQQEHVGVFREDDDIGHVDLCPHQQMKLKDGDLLYAAPQAQPMSDEQSAWFIKEYSFSGTSTRAECLIRAVERFHKIGG